MTSGHALAALLREREALLPVRRSIPSAWALLEAEIARTATSGVRKRVKLRVPAERYPEYNFVGRLLGPRGITLKTLERDTKCRIMIRGRGSVRKDREDEVRGRPGYEHVFEDPLHVVIEPLASNDIGALRKAKEAVELLLVPVPEDRDELKRRQLRDLAILNGTFRGQLPTHRRPESPASLATAALRAALDAHNASNQEACELARLVDDLISDISPTSVEEISADPLFLPYIAPFAGSPAAAVSPWTRE